MPEARLVPTPLSSSSPAPLPSFSLTDDSGLVLVPPTSQTPQNAADATSFASLPLSLLGLDPIAWVQSFFRRPQDPSSRGNSTTTLADLSASIASESAPSDEASGSDPARSAVETTSPPSDPTPRRRRLRRRTAKTSPPRRSRREKHLHSALWPLRFYPIFSSSTSSSASTTLSSLLLLSPSSISRASVLPPFPYNMSVRGKPLMPAVPAPPRVISPSPTPSEKEHSADGYFGPVTRSSARKRNNLAAAPQTSTIDELSAADDFFGGAGLDDESDEHPELRRSRTRSRSPMESRTRRINGLTAAKSKGKKATEGAAGAGTPATTAIAPPPIAAPMAALTTGLAPPPNGYYAVGDVKASSNGHLSPPSLVVTSSGWSWRDFSRSPSPLGLIPIHRHWRTLVHKHEVPRKVLHVSIGFVVAWLYVSGYQTARVAPYLMAALVPIALTDWLRHHLPAFNRFYVSVLGALMRESEFAGWNGVIWYLLGAWIVLRWFPKDVGVMGVMLLSWCDTAASTFGRAWGRYTPRIRRGKSLAGSAAAFLVGVGTAAAFWGWLAPRTGPFPGDDLYPFMFQGTLGLPQAVCDWVGVDRAALSVSGGLAIAVLSVWSGFVAAASEVVDIFGWDDNITIPVLSGLGIWGFLKVFA